MKFKFLLALLACTLIFACSDNELANDSFEVEVIQSKADFQQLVNQDVYPLNQLSEEALNHFKSNLVFVDNTVFKGGDYSQIRAELNDAEFTAFWQTILGSEAVAVGKDMAEDRGPQRKILLDRRPSDCYPTNVQTYCVMIPPQ